MGYHNQSRSGYCLQCQAPRLLTRTTYRCPHWAHALITLFLLGFWLPVWILHALLCGHEPWLCTQCGSRSTRR